MDVEQEDGVIEAVGTDTGEFHVPATRSERHSRRRPTPLGTFGAAFAILLLSGVSVAVANFNAGSTLFAWTSIALSGGAAVLTVASLVLRPAEPGVVPASEPEPVNIAQPEVHAELHTQPEPAAPPQE